MNGDGKDKDNGLIFDATTNLVDAFLAERGERGDFDNDDDDDKTTTAIRKTTTTTMTMTTTFLTQQPTL